MKNIHNMQNMNDGFELPEEFSRKTIDFVKKLYVSGEGWFGNYVDDDF
eukprot:CAMPEP_0114018136 /NCGR_PEP_ID=MMETSP0372-20130328/15321_1 /TAXON_ID=340204 /ORGANISM="Lankesteria abbotti" /LENGTH=47 /assembly_acc=CAM_ASM_000359